MIIHFVYISHYAYQLYDFMYINYFMDSLSKDIKNDMLNGQKTIFYQLIAQEVSLASKNSDATFGLDFLNHTLPVSVGMLGESPLYSYCFHIYFP